MGAKALLRLQGRAGKVLPPSPHHRGARGHALAPPCSTQNWWEALQNAFHFALSQVGLHCVGHALQKGLPMESCKSNQKVVSTYRETPSHGGTSKARAKA